MRSPTSVMLDVPQPLLLKPPPGAVTSAAAEAIDFAEEVCGIYLDPWQKWFVEMALSERSDGSWAAFEVGLVCPRQNGKNFILEVVQIACVYLFGDTTLVHSAHKFDTSVEHFQRLKWLFENTPELSELLLPGDRSFVTANGKEHIRFNTGQRILFKARYRGAGRGFTGDKVFLDEAYDLPAKAIGALIPTLSTRPMAQVWYTASAPHEDSSVLHAVRNRGIANDPTDRLVYVEFGNPDGVEDTEEAIRRANPAIASGRISEEYIRQEILTFSGDAELVEEHRRERMGIASMPPSTGNTGPIKLARWLELVDEKSTTVGPVSYAIDVSPDFKWGSFATAGRRADGHLHVEVGKRDRETGWIVGHAKQSPPGTEFRIAPTSPAGFLIPLLQEAGVSVIEVSSQEVTQSCSRLISAVAEGTVHSLGGNELPAAISNATISQRGDAQAWSRVKSSGDISALCAATIAVGGVAEAAESWLFE